MSHPVPDTWETYSERHFLPESVYYGQREIDLHAMFDNVKRRTTLLDSVRSYKALWDLYMKFCHDLDPEDLMRVAFVVGMREGLLVLRSVFELPIPEAPLPPFLAVSDAPERITP